MSFLHPRGGPHSPVSSMYCWQSSPHMRRWPGPGVELAHTEGVVPAHAGVVHRQARFGCRGWCRPAHAGLSDVNAKHYSAIKSSPRTRGWSEREDRIARRDRVVPAHAGMIPRAGSQGSRRRSRPRVRAGVVRSFGKRTCLSWSGHRARRGGPIKLDGEASKVESSPHAREWSLPVQTARVPRLVVPAHAGVVPTRSGRPTGRWSRPWARGVVRGSRGWDRRLLMVVPPRAGDGPDAFGTQLLTGALSPRAGGGPDVVFMETTQVTSPRARGDGP
jgi:hypothetical protein